MTADEILDALIAASSEKIWAIEVPFGKSRIDFWTLEPTRSAGFRATSYEIKVSRSDFNRDSEEKQEGTLRYSDRFFYVTPSGLLEKREIPEWAGLLEWDGEAWRVKKRSPKLEKAQEPGWGVIVDIIRNSGQCRRDIALMMMRIEAAERIAKRATSPGGLALYGRSRQSRFEQRFRYRALKDLRP